METIGKSLLDIEKADIRADKRFRWITIIVLTILLFITAMFSFVLFTVQVVGPSMEGTLYNGDYLIVNKQRTPDNGDIIIVDRGSDWIIKRVIAVGGQTVQIQNGRVYVDGKELEERYAKGTTEALNPTYANVFTVPEGRYFYLGDNRENSSDSRQNGTCDIHSIVGVVEGWSVTFKSFNNVIFKIFSFLSGGNVS